MNLIIVESPTKAKTIGQFIGEEYTIESCYGHVRDLPKSKLGIDIERNFEPHYITPQKKRKAVTHLKKIAAKADRVILATDEDREGEAIAWHLVQALDLEMRNDAESHGAPEPKKDAMQVRRIVFHEITKSAIHEALKNPRALNMNLIHAQQARRVLDRLVGYTLSPFLWKKIMRGLSAGRVQSVALKLIADREEEIKKFIPEEYWTIAALLSSTRTGARTVIEAMLTKIGEEPVPKLGIKTQAETEKIVRDLASARFSVVRIEKKQLRKNPLPPFTTSTLQQEATKRLGFTAKKTMFLAQGLYERGFITYMRTDSVHLAKEALRELGRWIEKNLPKEYHRSSPRPFRTTSRLAQEAHEAIRPTDVEKTAQAISLEKDFEKLYDLIWRRAVASQLPEALLDATTIEILAVPDTNADTTPYTLKTHGIVLLFDGFLKVWPTKLEEKELPELQQDEALTLDNVVPAQHLTEPPPRYNEASLIKTLEKYGIGRPSTYAPTISVIQERNYVEKNQGRFYPTEVGMLVHGLLKDNFPEIVDVAFTAKMEQELDDVAEGKESWQNVIREFYSPFSLHLERKYETVKKYEFVNETTNEICNKCGKPMTVKYGRFGKFLACSGFPECKNAKSLKAPPKSTGVRCEKCLASPERKESPGELVEKRVSRGRARGRMFWGCSKYPECDNATWKDPTKRTEQEVQGGAS